ncbi:hypothetical protein M0813_21357 [Anaeramoeba flamelloides]|uniref:Uncharacterized protein n=1 Tax=Anaeramoeba flamelloides TaxID=1746091 RepID=A0ABQ8YHS2_9EUKA|nr:hypothetical protein M0813_21357 [Anaeramoeba flamelloides]
MTNPNHSVPLTELQIEFQKIRRFKDRLQKLMEIRPGSVQGVTIKQLQSDPLVNKKRSKRKKQSMPKEILVKRSGIRYLSELTQLKKKSVERGLSIFCEKTFNLYNTREYSREWMIFRPERPQKRKNPEKIPTMKHKSLPVAKYPHPQQKKRATLNSISRVQSEPFTLPKDDPQKSKKSKSKFNLKFKKKTSSLSSKFKKRNKQSQRNTNNNFQNLSKEKTKTHSSITATFFKTNNSKIDKQLKSQIFHFNTQQNPNNFPSFISNNVQNSDEKKKDQEKEKEKKKENENKNENENEKENEIFLENNDEMGDEKEQQNLKSTLPDYSQESTTKQTMNEFQKRFYEITFHSNETGDNQLTIDNDIHWSTLGDIWGGDPNKIFL